MTATVRSIGPPPRCSRTRSCLSYKKDENKNDNENEKKEEGG